MATSDGVGITEPESLETMDVDGGLLRKAWSNELTVETLLEEHLFLNANIMEEIKATNEPRTLSEKVIVNVTPGGADGKANRSITLPFLRSLDDTGRFGNAEGLIGNAEILRLKYAQFHAGDWSHAVAGDKYGIDFREMSPLKVYNFVKKLLAQWKGEVTGHMIRSAIFETRSFHLTKAPLSLTQPLNPNWFVPGLADASQPGYDSTAATHEENIGAALAAVTYTDCYLNVSRILDLAEYLKDQYIGTTEQAGTPVYLLYLHPDEIQYNIDPSKSDSWAKYWNSSGAAPDINKVVPGSIGMIGDSIVCVRDQRAPTISLSGNSADYTVGIGYQKQGRSTTRTTARTANTNFNGNYVLGKMALGRYESENPHYEEQLDEFKKIINVGYVGAEGYELVNWDIDTATDDTMQSEGTYIIPTQR